VRVKMLHNMSENLWRARLGVSKMVSTEKTLLHSKLYTHIQVKSESILGKNWSKDFIDQHSKLQSAWSKQFHFKRAVCSYNFENIYAYFTLVTII